VVVAIEIAKTSADIVMERRMRVDLMNFMILTSFVRLQCVLCVLTRCGTRCFRFVVCEALRLGSLLLRGVGCRFVGDRRSPDFEPYFVAMTQICVASLHSKWKGFRKRIIIIT